MNSKKILKIFSAATVLTLIGGATVFATEEPSISPDSIDTVPPVFDSNIQTTYVVKRSEDGSKFNPQETIKGISATDDVDGNNVDIKMVENNVELSLDGEYQVLYTATDKSGNTSSLVVTVFVDGIAPTFDESIEKEYHINKIGIILDSKNNVVEALPKTLIAKDSLGTFKGIGIYMASNENGDVVILGTLENTPADKELQVNDIILKVNGENMSGQTSAYVATKIKGVEGTEVEITVLRNNQEITKVFKRAIVKVHEDEDVIAEPNIDVESIDIMNIIKNKDVIEESNEDLEDVDVTNQVNDEEIEEVTAEPDIEVESIVIKNSGTIEITYTATDEAGNQSEFVVTIVIEEEEPILNEDDKSEEEDDIASMVTTGDVPPEELDINLPKTNLEDEEETKQDDLEVDTNIENVVTEESQTDLDTELKSETNIEE